MAELLHSTGAYDPYPTGPLELLGDITEELEALRRGLLALARRPTFVIGTAGGSSGEALAVVSLALSEREVVQTMFESAHSCASSTAEIPLGSLLERRGAPQLHVALELRDDAQEDR